MLPVLWARILAHARLWRNVLFYPKVSIKGPGRDIIGQNRLGAQDGHIGTDGTYRPLQI